MAKTNGNLLEEFKSNQIKSNQIKLHQIKSNQVAYQSKGKRYFVAADKRSRTLIKHKLLQTSWTALCGAVAVLEALVLAWWAEKLYQVWSRLYSFVVAIRLPWQARTEVEAVAEATPVAVTPKRSRRQQPVDARDVCYNLLML